MEKVDVSVKEELKYEFLMALETLHAKELEDTTSSQRYQALARVVRDRISNQWLKTNREYKNKKVKQVYYLSMEFLIGKMLERNLINLDLVDECREALKDLGLDFDELKELEPDAGLGNGGLGRLAACFIDSMSSLSLPGHGCGIRYKYGLFKQEIKDGYQVEVPDLWLKERYPWEVKKKHRSVKVKFGGDAYVANVDGKLEVVHENYYTVKAIPYDIPISGYKNNTVNTLRLWSAEADTDEFDFVNFNSGRYMQSVEGKYTAELISQVLYPDDSTESGKQLRLKQEYFFVSSSLQSILAYYKGLEVDFYELDRYIAVHINDTHPALAVAEMMRLLLDEYSIGWDKAWDITKKVCAYTNHTILAEALEKWSIDMFKRLLPRIYLIVDEINRRFCQEVMNNSLDAKLVNKMSIIDNGVVKMANLAIVGSHSVNGVAALHTEILKTKELKEFNDFYPDKFNNKTNGITHRRWLIKSNPRLSILLDELIGNEWRNDPLKLEELIKFKDDIDVLNKLWHIKRENKLDFIDYMEETSNIQIDPNSIFDIQVKRVHGYKRQLLNCLHILYLYKKIKNDKDFDMHPRTFIFSAKAAPSYYFAKNVIKLINTLGDIINNDPDVAGRIKVVFVENYSVTKAEKIIPAADVSEQISTASKEASGTGNMKFMMNGAVTIATLDGANVEIHELVGDDNIVLFGLTSEEVIKLYDNFENNTRKFMSENKEVAELVSTLVDGSLGVVGSEFSEICRYLIEENDYFFVLKDFWAYVEAQQEIEKLYRDKKKWMQMCLVNIAKSGNFSSDNTIKRYADEIWNIKCEVIE